MSSDASPSPPRSAAASTVYVLSLALVQLQTTTSISASLRKASFERRPAATCLTMVLSIMVQRLGTGTGPYFENASHSAKPALVSDSIGLKTAICNQFESARQK